MSKDITSKPLDPNSNEVRFAFNPKRDIQQVDQFGFVDLRSAFVNHSLPGTLEAYAENQKHQKIYQAKKKGLRRSYNPQHKLQAYQATND